MEQTNKNIIRVLPDDIFINILHYLPFSSLYMLSICNKQTYFIVRQHAFKIFKLQLNNKLSKYSPFEGLNVDNIFKCELFQKACLTGGFMLSSLLGEEWEDQDIDIFFCTLPENVQSYYHFQSDSILFNYSQIKDPTHWSKMEDYVRKVYKKQNNFHIRLEQYYISQNYTVIKLKLHEITGNTIIDVADKISSFTMNGFRPQDLTHVWMNENLDDHYIDSVDLVLVNDKKYDAIINSFDIEACECRFDGKTLYVPNPFNTFTKTSYFNTVDADLFRIKKYQNRGFKLIAKQ